MCNDEKDRVSQRRPWLRLAPLTLRNHGGGAECVAGMSDEQYAESVDAKKKKKKNRLLLIPATNSGSSRPPPQFAVPKRRGASLSHGLH